MHVETLSYSSYNRRRDIKVSNKKREVILLKAQAWKKVLLLVLALSMIVVMAACSNDGEENPNNGTTPDNTTPDNNKGNDGNTTPDPAGEENYDPLGAFEEEVTLTMGGRQPSADASFSEGFTQDNNHWWTLYKDQLNLNVEFEWQVESNQYNRRMNLAIGSGDIPDVLSVSFIQLFSLIEADMIADLTDAYNNYASPLTKEIMSIDPKALEGVTIDGKIMAIPDVRGFLDRPTMLWIRTDWLKAVGMDAPKTVDEMLDVMRAFKDQDPDGNGEPDTYGLAVGDNPMGSNHGIGPMFSAFGAHQERGPANGAPFFIEEDGKAVWVGETQGMKDALSTMNQMYDEGLLREDFYNMTTTMVKEDISTNKVGMAFGVHWLDFDSLNGPVLASLEDGGAPGDVDWTAVRIPTNDPNEKTKYPYNNFNSTMTVLKKGHEHPEALVKTLNLWIEIQYGEMNTVDNREKYLSADSTKLEAQPTWSVIKGVYKPDKNQLSVWPDVLGAINGEIKPEDLDPEAKSEYDLAMEWKNVLDGNAELPSDSDALASLVSGGWGSYNWYYGANGDDSPRHVIQEYVDEDAFEQNAFMGPVNMPILKAYDTVAKNSLPQKIAKIIYGEDTVESWDDYLQNWHDEGGYFMKELAQDWIDNN